MGMSTFKRMHTAEERAADAARMRLKYPDRIPVIVEKAAHTDMPELDKKKFLVPEEVTVGQFVHIIGKRLHLRSGRLSLSLWAMCYLLQHLYWRAYTMSTRIMMDSCISVTVGRKHLAKKDDFILLCLYIGSK